MHTPFLKNRVLDLDLLRVFVQVAQTGSFSLAAKSLSRTQSAVSMQIRRLEEQIGCALIYRKKGGAQPTPEGISLLEVANEMLALNDRIFEQLNSAVVSGLVRIGAIEPYARAVLPELIANFCALYPEVLVEIHTGIPKEMLGQIRTRFDLVIGMSEAGSGTGTTLATSRVTWAVAPGHSPHRQSPVPLAMGVEGTLFRRWGTHALESAGMRWRMAYCSSSVAALEGAVSAGLAVGIFSEHTLDKRLVPLGTKDGLPALPSSEVWIMRSEKSTSKAVTLLHDFIVNAIHRHQGMV